ncbi:MAG: hypothetical protein P8188_14560 [Gemmatimonadota bacterium]
MSRPEGGHFNVVHHDTVLQADVHLAGEVLLDRRALERVPRLPGR